MSALSIQPTYPIFTETDGQPLEDGYIWIGTANLDPQVNPINVYWDAALTLPAAQPIRTLAGYPANSGTPARLYVNSDYSIRVMNKNGSTVYSAPAATERYSDVVVSGVNAEDVIYDPPFTGAVAETVEAKLTQTVSVKDFGAVGDGVTDDTAAIQAAIDAITSGETLYFTAGSYKVTNYLSISNKNNFSIVMDGIVVPTGTLNSTSNGLFNFDTCTNFDVIPNIKNATYTSTINCIRLVTCSNVKIYNGLIDVKYNSFDGTAAIQLANNVTDVEISGNYIRSGYGVLANNSAGVFRINIHHNNFVGQKAYGSTGTGDGIEGNFNSNYSEYWYIENNTFSEYEVHNPGGLDARMICVGLSKVYNFTINENKFFNSEMEAIHIENGCAKGTINGNNIEDGVIGINITPNTTLDIFGLVISNNQINLPAMPTNPAFTADYGAAILCNVNSLSTGATKNITIVGNKCEGNNLASRGICLYDVDGFTLGDNLVRDFPRAGFDLRKFAGLGTGIINGSITNNVSIANGWNYILGGISGSGPFTYIYFDESNIAKGSLFGLNYNSEISDRTGSTVRIPYAVGNATRKLTAGDLVVFSDGSVEPVITSGAAGAWKASDGEIVWSKSGSGTSATVTITFASYSSANIPTTVEITANGCAVNGLSREAIVAKYVFSHSTGVNSIVAFGTDDVSAGPITITPSNVGLTAVFTIGFTSGYTNNVTIKINQAYIHDTTIGGVVSIT